MTRQDPSLGIQPVKSIPHWFWIAGIVAAVAVAILLRFGDISSQSIWFDEGYTAWMVSHPPREILRLIRADTAPPLYYLLLRQWTDLFGGGAAGLRSMSAVASLVSLAMVLAIARRMRIGWPAMLAIAWALALGFRQKFYAQEARFYALMAMELCVIVYCLLRHLEAKRRGWIAPMALLVCAAMYTHNMMAPYLLMLVPAWLILPSLHSNRRRVADGLLTLLAALVLYLPWAAASLLTQIQMVHRDFWVLRPTAATTAQTAAWLLSVPASGSWDIALSRVHLYFLHVSYWPLALALGLLALAIVLIFRRGSSADRANAWALSFLIFGAPILVLAYSAIAQPIQMDKLFLPSATLMPVLLMMPLGLPLRGWPRAGSVMIAVAFVALGAGTLVNYSRQEEKEDWRDAAKIVSALPPAHRLIVFCAEEGELPFDFYYRYRPGEAATGVPAGFFDRNPPRTMIRVHGPADLLHLDDLLVEGQYHDVVLLYAHQPWNDPEHLTLQLLQQRFPWVSETDLHDVTVYWFRS